MGDRLAVNPVACDGIGMCARLAPDLVALDRWGFPILGERDVDDSTEGPARRAIRGCPKRALFLEVVQRKVRDSSTTP